MRRARWFVVGVWAVRKVGDSLVFSFWMLTAMSIGAVAMAEHLGAPVDYSGGGVAIGGRAVPLLVGGLVLRLASSALGDRWNVPKTVARS